MSTASVIPRTIEAPAGPGISPQAAGLVGNAVANAGDQAGQFANAMLEARDESAVVKARLSVAQQLDDLHQQYLTDNNPETAPQRFADAANKIAEGAIAGIEIPKNREAFTADVGNMIEGRRVSIMDHAFARETSSAIASLGVAQETYSRQAAFATNPVERDAAITAYQNSVAGTVNKGMLNPDDAQKMVQGFSEKLALYDGRQLVTANPAAAQKKLSDPNFLPSLDPLARVELQSSAETEIRVREREARAQLAEARASAHEALAEFDSVVGTGLPPSPDVLDQTRAAVRASGDAKLANHFSRSIRAANFAASLRGASQSEVEGSINALDAKAATSGADPALASAEKGARAYLIKMNAGLAHDPLDWASRQGVVQLAPLKLDGSASAADWQARAKAANLAAQHYGTPVNYFTKTELGDLAAKLDVSQPADARLRTVHMLVDNMGGNAVSVLGQLSTGRGHHYGGGIDGRDPLGALATAGGLLTDGPQYVPTARDIANGETVLRARPEMKPQLSSFTGDGSDASLANMRAAYSAMPQEFQRTLDAAQSIYAKRAADASLTGKDTDTREGAAIMAQALDAAAGAHYVDGTKMGGVTLYNGAPIIAPNNVAAQNVEDLVHHLTVADMARSSVTGAKPVIGGQDVPDDTLRNGWLVTTGNGTYAVSTTDPTAGQVTPLRDAKGRIYRLDFNKALTLLQQRSGK